MKFPLRFREVYATFRVDPESGEEIYDNLALGVRQKIDWHPQLEKYWPVIEWLHPLADPYGHAGDFLFGEIVREEGEGTGREVDIEYDFSLYPKGKRPIRRLRPLTLAFWNAGVVQRRAGYRQPFDNLARLKAHLWDEALDGTDWWKEFPPLPSGYKPEKEAEKEPGEEKSKS